MAQIFLSYSHEDKDFVDHIEPRIQNIFGLSSLWYDRSKDGLKGGDNWWENIVQEIRFARVFIFLVSDSSLASEWCIKELREALTRSIRVIPVLLTSYNNEYPDGFPAEMANKMQKIQYVDYKYGHEDLSILWGAILRESELLSKTERWLLYNQYQILRSFAELRKGPSAIRESEISAIDINLDVLSYGYERHYPLISPFSDPPVKYEDGELVWEILEMFSTLTSACREIDCSDIEHNLLEFWGFDTSRESQYWSYANLILNKEKRYQEITPLTENVDSHIPMLPIYKAMLEEWRKCNKFDLSKEDVIRITSARKQIRV